MARNKGTAADPTLNKAQEVEDDEGGGQGGDTPGKKKIEAGDAEDEGDEGGDDNGEEDEDMAEKGCKKSEDLTQDDLEKSLNKLDEYVVGADKPSRKAQLLEKATGGELSKGEREELFQILGGADESKTGLGTELTKGLAENDTLQKALDVSDYLQEQHAELCKSLQSLGEHIEKSDSRQHEFNLLLAKAITDIGGLTKSVSERLEGIEGQPARAPKSRGVTAPNAQPLEKSFAGQAAGGGAEFSKAEALEAMQDLLVKSVDAGKGGVIDGAGDMGVAISKFEQFNVMSPGVHARVVEHLQAQRTAH